MHEFQQLLLKIVLRFKLLFERGAYSGGYFKELHFYI